MSVCVCLCVCVCVCVCDAPLLLQYSVNYFCLFSLCCCCSLLTSSHRATLYVPVSTCISVSVHVCLCVFDSTRVICTCVFVAVFTCLYLCVCVCVCLPCSCVFMQGLNLPAAAVESCCPLLFRTNTNQHTQSPHTHTHTHSSGSSFLTQGIGHMITGLQTLKPSLLLLSSLNTLKNKDTQNINLQKTGRHRSNC